MPKKNFRSGLGSCFMEPQEQVRLYCFEPFTNKPTQLYLIWRLRLSKRNTVKKLNSLGLFGLRLFAQNNISLPSSWLMTFKQSFRELSIKKVVQLLPHLVQKWKKLWATWKKNKLWTKNDQIAVIACTNKPYDANIKDVKKLFDKKMYFPYPNYATRKLLIKHFIE